MAAKRSVKSIEELIGRKIWFLRKARGLSQEILAEKSGINASFLGCIERGQKCPTLRVLEKIRLALDITYTEFFDFSSERESGNKEGIRERFVRLLKDLVEDDLILLDGILEVFLQKIPQDSTDKKSMDKKSVDKKQEV